MAADAFDRGRRSQKHDDMNKLLTLGLLGLTSLPMCAQDIYKIENFAGEDLNGTARYIGMGGSMSALGAEISTMGTNPAGTALYRRSDFAMSAGLNSQPNALDFANRGKTRASFDRQVSSMLRVCRPTTICGSSISVSITTSVAT